MTTAAQEAPTPAARAKPLWRRMVMWALIVVVIGAAAEPARLGSQELVPQPLEHDHDDLGGVADRRDRLDDRADDRDGVRLVLDPPLRLPRAGEVA